MVPELFFYSGEFFKSSADLLVLPEQFLFRILEIGNIPADRLVFLHVTCFIEDRPVAPLLPTDPAVRHDDTMGNRGYRMIVVQ